MIEKELCAYVETVEAGEFINVKSIRGSNTTVLISIGNSKAVVELSDIYEALGAIVEFQEGNP